MGEQRFDIVIIGSGPGGYVAAVRAAKLGFSVAVVERESLGGVCLNWGCIPTKNLLQTAETYRSLQHLEKMGLTASGISFDFGQVVARSRQAAGTLNKGVGHLLKNNGVTVVKGNGRLAGPGQVEVTRPDGSGETLRAAHVILATGGRSKTIPGVAIDGRRVLGSREALALSVLPKSMAIVGAGAIGVEFAYFYSAFGCAVTLLEALPRILPNEDEEVSALLAKAFKKNGIKVEAAAKIEAIAAEGEPIAIRYAVGEERRELAVDRVLMAVGVSGNSEDLGLEKLGIKTSGGFVEVDDGYQTSCPGVYAIGDLAGPPLLAHVASAEGIHLVERLKGLHQDPLDYGNIPACTYCQPQVASLGLTEEKARAAGHEIKVGRFPFGANGKALATDHALGFVKLIFDGKSEKLLGAHIIGYEATELLAELGLAKALGATWRQILHTVHAHPTLSEAVMEAAGAAGGEAIHV
jgi:dihydrolipoamide dehydrogenase